MLGQIVFNINLTFKHFCKPKYQPKMNNIWAIVSLKFGLGRGPKKPNKNYFSKLDIYGKDDLKLAKIFASEIS